MTDKSTLWQIFNTIAPRYDQANRVLSFGQDILWRKRVKSFLPQRQQLRVLDLATGTGDLLIELAKSPKVSYLTGIDMAENMLAVGQRKCTSLIKDGRVEFLRADAMALPFSQDSFDVATMAFGIRNVFQPAKCLIEIHRVLRSQGRIIILEFSLPRLMLIRQIYLLYFRHVLPWLGGIISGNKSAYRYLNSSVEVFPYGQEFADMLRRAGFSCVSVHSLSCGIATIYVGER